MSILDKAQTFLRRFRVGSEPSEESMYSRRHDGSLSGYHPNVIRQQPQQQEQQPVPETPSDAWAQPYAQEPLVAQASGRQPVVDMYGYPQQSYQQLWPQQDMSASYVAQASGYQPLFQSPQANQPGSPFVGYQPQFQQQAQPAPQPVQQQPVPDNISYMPGGIIGRDGREYLHTMRVAQITGVADCYALMENMRNNETVVVNLDLMPDNAEIDRCLDLLYGACYALQCQFNQVSSRNVYLLTPGVVQVEHAENLRRQSEYEMDNRWPDPNNLAYRQRAMAREQNNYGSYAQSGYAPNYQNSYSGMGRRTGSRAVNAEYTDFGGFPNAGRF